ncbi:hypothetical protein MBLNU13_g05692t1 [Cladosporium sp. NU13]
MADPLSIAAAGAGFLSLAGQVADGLIKLRAFYKASKYAPKEVQSLCDEMDVVRSLLEIAGSRTQNGSPPRSDHIHSGKVLAQFTTNGKKSVEEAPSVESTRIVRLPYWFLQQEYALQLRRATAGWLFSRPVHRIVPQDCSLFEACRIGDIESIRTLLSTREASPFDRTACGATALQFAMEGGQLEVCRLLRQAGIFSQFRIIDYRRTFASLQRSMSDFSDHNRSLLRTVVGHDDPDREWFVEHCEEMYEDEGQWIRHIYAEADLFSLLLRADHKTALLQISDLKAYAEARNTPFSYPHFLPFISRILSNSAVIHQIRLMPHNYTWLVYALAHEIAQDRRDQEEEHQ